MYITYISMYILLILSCCVIGIRRSSSCWTSRLGFFTLLRASKNPEREKEEGRKMWGKVSWNLLSPLLSFLHSNDAVVFLLSSFHFLISQSLAHTHTFRFYFLPLFHSSQFFKQADRNSVSRILWSCKRTSPSQSKLFNLFYLKQK
jgi:hypothetical protein